jgi:DNA modification methylase
MIDMETSVVSDLKSRAKAQPDGYTREKACEQQSASGLSTMSDFAIDLVMGFGTTAIAAEISERSWIGIDIS